MSASRSGLPLGLVAMLAACAATDDGRAGPQTAAVTPAADTSAGAWGCEEPQPGHPTAAEKTEFVEEVGALAAKAEERHGVPAAAITAMAILESGYGWTRLAQNTNNLLGWKYFADTPGGEREFWVLDCPGSHDRFIVFRDRAEAIDFVADQLATSDNYRADSERYRRDRASGMNVAEAVDRWVDGIADPYSSNPEAYRSDLRRIMHDTYELADGRRSDLYSLSEPVSPPRA